MKFTFMTGMPYTFYADSGSGETRYSIGEYKGDDPEVIVEVTAETWDRLLRAQQVEHLQVLATAIDGDHAVGMGRLLTIARRVNDIADEIAPMCDHDVVFDDAKAKPESEPS